MFQFNTAYPDSRFYVSIDDRPLGLFTEISGLEIDIETEDYAEGGNNTFVHRLPGRAKVNNLVLKRGMTTATDFQSWLMDVSLGKIKRRHVTVTMYDASSLPLQSWNFLNAYPVKWSGPQLRVTQGTAAVETLELAHEGIILLANPLPLLATPAAQ